MATLGAIYDRINSDYLNRTDLTAETKRAVAGAVRFYERQRFWFNEASTQSVTVASSANFNLPADFLVLDRLRYPAGPWSLIEVDLHTMQDMRNGSATGKPTHFTIYAGSFTLYPTPDNSYSLTVAYVRQLPILSATTATASTNDWFSAAEDLIVFHATKLMWANVLRNTEEALKYAELERRAYQMLLAANEQRVPSSGMKATRF